MPLLFEQIGFCDRSDRSDRSSFRRGFSFLEILVACIFLMLGVSFLVSVYKSSNQGTLDSYRETIAYWYLLNNSRYFVEMGKK